MSQTVDIRELNERTDHVSRQQVRRKLYTAVFGIDQ